jgi:predicted dehydrogenase
MTSRREFLGAAAASATSRVLGANDRINLGIIGAGGMGFGHIKMLKPRTDVRIAAVSDIYTKRKERARDFLGLADKDIHHEYKDLLARSDVDAVFVVTPDHWHYRMAMDALDAGKDVYVQKPMAYRIEEAKSMAERVKKTGRVLQVGSQYASEAQYHRAREVVAQGAHRQAVVGARNLLP